STAATSLLSANWTATRRSPWAIPSPARLWCWSRGRRARPSGVFSTIPSTTSRWSQRTTRPARRVRRLPNALDIRRGSRIGLASEGKGEQGTDESENLDGGCSASRDDDGRALWIGARRRPGG